METKTMGYRYVLSWGDLDYFKKMGYNAVERMEQEAKFKLAAEFVDKLPFDAPILLVRYKNVRQHDAGDKIEHLIVWADLGSAQELEREVHSIIGDSQFYEEVGRAVIRSLLRAGLLDKNELMNKYFKM